MRLLAAICGCLLVTIATCATASADVPVASIVLHADDVSYYSNRFIIGADGNVDVRLSDGTRVTGRTFSMDLKANRFIVAGRVVLSAHGSTYEGAAFAMFLDYKRAYFVPFIDQPDRWTFLDNDYREPAKGREMPGDAFALPDLSGERPFVVAKTARITPKEGVAFSPAAVYVVLSYVPGPTYYQNISANPNFAQNSLAGATADVGYPFAGGPKSLSAFHLRYDSPDRSDANKVPYLAFEQHFVGKRNYAVVSVNPITQPQKQYNLNALARIGSKFQVYTFDQVSAFQRGLSRPLSASSIDTVQLNYALPNSFVQFNLNQFYSSLLAEPQPDAIGQKFYGDPGHPFVPNHPVQAQLSWNGADRRLGKTPVYYRSRAGMLMAHEGYGLGDFNGTPYTTLYTRYLGGTLYTDAYKISKRSLPSDRATTLQLVYDRQRTYFSVPRAQEQSVTQAVMARGFGPKLQAYLSYSVSNFNDIFGLLQSRYYPGVAVTNTVNNRIYPGYAAYSGISTSRALSTQFTYSPTQYALFNVQLQRFRDFPEPIPFVLGQPPLQLNLRTHLRLAPSLSVDLARSYYFNYANLRWSPRFAVQFGP